MKILELFSFFPLDGGQCAPLHFVIIDENLHRSLSGLQLLFTDTNDDEFTSKQKIKLRINQ